MKTFEEALAAVCQSDGKHESNERLKQAQGEFMAEVFGNEILAGLAAEFINTLAGMVGDGEVAMDDAMLALIFLNGVNLGVSIGVQMEKAEVEQPSPLKRISKYFKSRVAR